ncbi:hypothetical protein BDF14DRAFT_1747635 [Spinellus fusiger]|nr:hypothetical protein BDF14DRAFT_1747635 [Spinellus fusiger]
MLDTLHILESDDEQGRAGTLSRRHTGKQAYYHSSTNTAEPTHHLRLPHFFSRFSLHRRLRPTHRLAKWAVGCTVVLLLVYSYLIKTTPQQPQQLQQPIPPHIDYPDTSQWVDSSLLRSLLLHSLHTSSPPQRTQPPPLLSLLSLQQKIDQQPIAWTDREARTVSVVALIHTSNTSLPDLHLQLQSILSQSIVPEAIWIVCPPQEYVHVASIISGWTNSPHVHTIATHDTGISWISVASRTATDYVWILNPKVMPGPNYLESILRLSSIEEYSHVLMGTEAATFSEQVSAMECWPSAHKELSMHHGQIIKDTWLLKRSWWSTVASTLPLDNPPWPSSFLGHLISYAVYQHTGAPCLVVPVNPINTSAWGNIQTDTEKQDLCRALNRDILREREMNTEFRRIDSYLKADTHDPSRKDTESSRGGIVIVLEGHQELNEFVPLICSFKRQNLPLSLITTGEKQGLSDEEVISVIQKYSSSCTNISVYALSIEPTPIYPSSFMAWERATTIEYSLLRLLERLQPRILLHGKQKTPVMAESIRSAGKQVNATVIGLPARDIGQSLWMADLPLDSLEQWHSFTIQLVIITDKSPNSLSRLVKSAARALYLGDTIDMTIVMEQTSDRVTQAFVNHLPWPHGEKTIRHRIVKVDPMPLFVEAWYPTHNHEYVIMLDEGVEVSSLFYVWAKYTLLRYRYSPETLKETASMFGISLYSPRLMETDPKGRRIFAPDTTLERFGYPRHSPYLMQAPSTSGALFFPEHWREFHDYVTVRLADQVKKNLQMIQVPNTRSSQWMTSWRRYFEELAYLRGYVMLYPNYENYTSFSTRHLELGSHIYEDYSLAVSLFRVPLMNEKHRTESPLFPPLPSLNRLPLLDLWGEMGQLESLQERGIEFHKQVSACEPVALEERHYDPSDMLCPFAQLVTVPVASEDEVVPDFPTRVVTLYVTGTPQPTSAVKRRKEEEDYIENASEQEFIEEFIEEEDAEFIDREEVLNEEGDVMRENDDDEFLQVEEEEDNDHGHGNDREEEEEEEED